MEIRVTRVGEVPLLVVDGEIDHHAADHLLRAAEAAPWRGVGVLLLDLTDCPYMDSGGLAALFSILTSMGRDGRLGTIAPTSHLRRLFEIVGLDKEPRFLVFETAEDASV